MKDLISREALLRDIEQYHVSDGLFQHWVEIQQPVEPTLHGYSIEKLAFIAAIMEKEGMSPEEVVAIFRDLNRVIEMMLEDMKEMQENALKQTLKKPWEGGQDGQN